MLSELQVDELVDRLTQIYSGIELQLMLKVIELLSKNKYNQIEGSLEWYLRKLAEMGTLNQDVIEVLAKASRISDRELKELLRDAQLGTFDMQTLNRAYNLDLIVVNPQNLMKLKTFQSLLETSSLDANGVLRSIRTKAIEGSKKAYMDVLTEAYVSVSSGAFDYNTSIQRAIKKLAQDGITVATYRNGAKFSIEPVVRREVLSAVNKLQNKTAEKECDEIGAEFVEVSAHYGARTSKTNPIANHYGWQGKVYHRGGAIDYNGKHYEDFVESTGYGDILGLAGVNCRHRFFPFFPDISVEKRIRYDETKNEQIYQATQHQRKLERQMRALKKEKAMLEMAGQSTTNVNARIKKQSQTINQWCKANGLQRKYERERVLEDFRDKPKRIVDKTPKAKTKTRKMIDYKSIKYDSVDYTQELLDNARPNQMDVSIAKEYINVDGEHFYEKDGLFEMEDFGQDEIDCANWLSETFGGDVQLVRRIRKQGGGHISTSDFLWNGKRYDLKSLDNLGKHAVSNRTSKSGQSENYIIDIGKISNKIENVEALAIQQCEGIFKNKYRAHVDSIILKNGDKLVKALRRAK